MQTIPTNRPPVRPQRRRRRRSRAVSWKHIGAFALALAAVLVILISNLGSDEPSKETKTQSSTPTEPSVPIGYRVLPMTQADMASGDLVLVNADYGYDASTAPELVSLYDNQSEHYYLRATDMELSRRALDPLNDWMEGFYDATGVMTLNVVASYRTEEYQQSLRDNAIAEHGMQQANDYIALPGHSEHHTGLAIDLDSYDAETGASGGFDGTGIYQWAVDHAWEYGFVQRYPLNKEDITGISYEEWHFRYVGQPHAQVMAERNLCLEEYIDFLKQYPANGEHLLVDGITGSYEIYYCAGLEVAVPQAGQYEISGNNVDGFIVTIQHT